MLDRFVAGLFAVIAATTLDLAMLPFRWVTGEIMFQILNAFLP